MKNSFYLIVLAVLQLAALAGCTGGSPSSDFPCNPYSLDIVTDMSIYNEQILANPDNELLDLEVVIPGIVADIRYATSNNFTGQRIYTMPKAFVRRKVAEALKQVQDSLVRLGLGLKVYDAYRPYSATLRFYEVYPDSNFVANPKYGSRHNRGCAVDVSLVNYKTGEELQMPTPFDEFSERANPGYMNLDKVVIDNRSLLISIMHNFGFDNYPTEWWHFDYSNWKEYKLMDISFEKLSKRVLK